MTLIENLTRYMYPYYQDVTDVAFLESLLVTHITPELSASVLWAQSATQIWSGNIKAFSTGTTSTTYQSLKEIMDFCIAQSLLYSNLDKVSLNNGSVFFATHKTHVAGGVHDW